MGLGFGRDVSDTDRPRWARPTIKSGDRRGRQVHRRGRVSLLRRKAWQRKFLIRSWLPVRLPAEHCYAYPPTRSPICRCLRRRPWSTLIAAATKGSQRAAGPCCRSSAGARPIPAPSAAAIATIAAASAPPAAGAVTYALRRFAFSPKDDSHTVARGGRGRSRLPDARAGGQQTFKHAIQSRFVTFAELGPLLC